MLAYKRVLLKLSGEAMSGDLGHGIDPDVVGAICDQIKIALDMGVEMSIVVGGGNIGQALVNYASFEKRGFVIKAVFDVNPRLIGMTIRGVEVYDIDKMEEFIKNNDIDVAILTLPRSQAAKVANDLAKWGIKGMWNFSHVDLQVPDDIIVENVHLTDSLMTLLYKINEMYAEESDFQQMHQGLPIKPIKMEDIEEDGET